MKTRLLAHPQVLLYKLPVVTRVRQVNLVVGNHLMWQQSHTHQHSLRHTTQMPPQVHMHTGIPVRASLRRTAHKPTDAGVHAQAHTLCKLRVPTHASMYLWLVQQCGVEQLQFQLDGLVVTHRVRGGAVKHMQQHTAAAAQQQQQPGQPQDGDRSVWWCGG